MQQEQEDYPNNPALQVQAIVTPTSDIWSVGKVMLSLMNLREDGEPIFFNSTSATLNFAPGVQARYPANLCNLVMRCLDLDAAQRPGIQVLSAAIQAEIVAGGGNLKTDGLIVGEVIDTKPDLYALFA